MIYFSEIKDRKVFTDYNVKVGVLEDLVFLVNGTAKITKLVIREPSGRRIIIPSIHLINGSTNFLHNPILIHHDYQIADIAENELYLLRNILDKQIIDLVGHKVVRVNDVAIQNKDEPYLAGVDIGVLGILRWFRLENAILRAQNTFRFQMHPQLLSWADIQPLELTHGKVVLKKEEKKLAKVHPEDLADYLEKTDIENTAKIIRLLDVEKATAVISNLNINYQTILFSKLKPADAARWISLLEPDDAVSILLSLTRKKREQIIGVVPEKKARTLQKQLAISKLSPIGKKINTNVITVPSTHTVKMVMEKIRKESVSFHSLHYIYVINEQEQLVGILSLHDLLLQEPMVPVYKCMSQNLITLHLNTPEETAVKWMLRYKLHALPVVDKKKHVLGTISIDELADPILAKNP